MRLFPGVDDAEVRNPSLSELPAHHTAQVADGGFGEIRDFEPSGIRLIAGAHTTDDRNPAFPCGLHQGDLCGNGVDRVNDIIAAVQKPVVISGEIKAVVCGDQKPGVDIQQALAHDLGLFSPKSAVQGENLTVQIRRGDSIVIYQYKRADPGSGEGFGGVAPDAAESEHGDAALL